MKKGFLLLVAILLMACSLTKSFTAKESPTAEEQELDLPNQTQEPTKRPEPEDTAVEITDAEFTELAQNVCQNLGEDLSDIATSDENFVTRYAMAAEVYQEAWDNLSERTRDADLGPLASEFLTHLEALTGLYEAYGQALQGSMDELGLTLSDISYLAVTSEDKAFMVFANEEWQELEVEEELKIDFYAAKAAFNTTASGLGLGACTEVDPIFD